MIPVIVLALLGHVISVEEINTRQINSVQNLSTGEITGSSWSGRRFQRAEIAINQTIFIVNGRESLSVGSDLQVDVDGHKMLIHGTDKKGRDKTWKFRIVGQKEKAANP